MEKEIKKLGNVGGGMMQGRSVYCSDGLCPTMIAGMDHGNTMPFIVEIFIKDKNKWKKC